MRARGTSRSGAGLAFVVVGVGAFVLGVYVLIVLGGGMLIGRTDSPSPALSVLATTVVALAFAPIQRALERVAVHHAATPYDVLARFAEGGSAEHLAEDLPARMSRLLAQGTGAQWAQVWLQVSGRLVMAGCWPSDANGDLGPAGMRSSPVRYGDQVLGELRLQERRGVPLTAVEERLFNDLASQAGPVLRLVGLRTELTVRHDELRARTRELESSRGRVIAAQDAERTRLERDIHDGAQQHLVALAVNLRLAQVLAARSSDKAAWVLAEQSNAARLAIETLSSLSRGIYPEMLSELGLGAALRSGATASPTPVVVQDQQLGRPPAAVEAALYFCCMEAIQNAVKHASATRVTVRLSQDERSWRLDVVDDGTGFDQAMPLAHVGSAGLMNMRDRLDAVGGMVTIASAAGAGTTISASVPARDH
jgi:signal transduction histidine kinase